MAKTPAPFCLFGNIPNPIPNWSAMDAQNKKDNRSIDLYVRTEQPQLQIVKTRLVLFVYLPTLQPKPITASVLIKVKPQHAFRHCTN